MKAALVLLSIVAACAAQRFIHPTFRPPKYTLPVLRTVRQAEPQWLYQGDIPRAPASSDHPTLPQYIDDIKLDPHTRTARSLSTPSAPGGHHPGDSKSGRGGNRGGQDTGSHLGPNQRYARSLRDEEQDLSEEELSGVSPFNERVARDLYQKPSIQHVPIPNWNPYIKTSPWDSLRPKH